MLKKFASIANSAQYGYAYDSEKWEMSGKSFLATSFRMFQTMGDGLIQHSGDWPVTEEYATDFMFSLAAAMLEDPEFCDAVGYTVNRGTCDEDIKFAASLVYKAEKDSVYGKHRYFSMELRKVTRDQEKQHDNRYKELREYHTGTPEIICGMVTPEYADGLMRWNCAAQVRRWCSENQKAFMEMPAVHLQWFKDADRQSNQYDRARQFRDSVEACKAAYQIVQARQLATDHLQNYQRRLEREKVAAEQAAQNVEVAA